MMAVQSTGEIYLCEICGNEVIVTKVGGGTLVCCGQEMKKVEDEDNETTEETEESEE